MILIACNSNQIFRHSLRQIIIYTYATKLTKPFRFSSAEPTFSDGKDCLC
jgi:hypothetical protein